MRVDNIRNSQFNDIPETNVVRWWQYLSYLAILFVLIYLSNMEVALASDPIPPAWLDPDAQYQQTLEASTEENESETQQETSYDSYTQAFTISAYYSPIEGQTKYVTGSLAGDIRLNGSGVNGADGTPVYPGMIAAPSTYPFGTKMHIPGIGTVAVHDRGGAIKGNRLDVWMGYGDKGLERALKWGKRTLSVQVYGVNPDIKEYVELDDYSESEKHFVTQNSTPTVDNNPAPSRLFSRQLNIGSSGNDVAELQKILKDLDLYDGEINAFFDKDTHIAVAKFQVSNNIVNSENAFGAGYVGPRTSGVLASVVQNIETAHAKVESIDTEGEFINDLERGHAGQDVQKLQEELKKINLFGIEPTGYYGELTEHAVFKFQQIYKLAGDKSSPGAGIFGPLTRSKMNEIVAARLKTEELIEESA